MTEIIGTLAGLLVGVSFASWIFVKTIRDREKAERRQTKDLLDLIAMLQNKLMAKDIAGYSALQEIDHPSKPSRPRSDEEEYLIAAQYGD